MQCRVYPLCLYMGAQTSTQTWVSFSPWKQPCYHLLNRQRVFLSFITRSIFFWAAHSQFIFTAALFLVLLCLWVLEGFCETDEVVWPGSVFSSCFSSACLIFLAPHWQVQVIDELSWKFASLRQPAGIPSASAAAVSSVLTLTSGCLLFPSVLVCARLCALLP